jgi:hypothetical protein
VVVVNPETSLSLQLLHTNKHKLSIFGIISTAMAFIDDDEPYDQGVIPDIPQADVVDVIPDVIPQGPNRADQQVRARWTISAGLCFGGWRRGGVRGGNVGGRRGIRDRRGEENELTLTTHKAGVDAWSNRRA